MVVDIYILVLFLSAQGLSYRSIIPTWRRRFELSYNSVSNTENVADTQVQEIKWLDEKLNMKASPIGSSIFEIPLFPADDFVPLPTGQVPIHMVEEEGLTMLNDIFAYHTDIIEYCDIATKKVYSLPSKKPIFGMVLRDGGRMAATGTLLSIQDHSTYEDDTQSVHCEGGSRFRILSIVQTKPYLIARVQCPIVDEDIPQQLPNTDTHSHQDTISASAYETAVAFKNDIVHWESLKQLELELWRNFTDVIELTHQYSGYISTDHIPDSVRQLAPFDSEASDLTRSELSDSQSSQIQKLHIPVVGNSDISHQARVDNNDRIRRMSDFSFAIAEIVAVSSEERQVLLQLNSVGERLSFLSRMLSKSRNFLKSVLFEGVTATIESVKGGYMISKPDNQALQ